LLFHGCSLAFELFGAGRDLGFAAFAFRGCALLLELFGAGRDLGFAAIEFRGCALLLDLFGAGCDLVRVVRCGLRPRLCGDRAPRLRARVRLV
jgi:hypothetical protein